MKHINNIIQFSIKHTEFEWRTPEQTHIKF